MKRWLLDYMGRTEKSFIFTMIITESTKDKNGVVSRTREHCVFETDSKMNMNEHAREKLKGRGLTDKQIEEAQQSLTYNRVKILFMKSGQYNTETM